MSSRIQCYNLNTSITRSSQLLKATELLCHQFGINSNDQKREFILADEKVSLQKALLQVNTILFCIISLCNFIL